MALTDPKNSKLKAVFDELQADKARIQAVSAPLRAERDKLQESIRPTEEKIRELNQQIKDIEQRGEISLADIDMQISAIAKAAGGKSMHASLLQEEQPAEA
jgi:predicted  nucleic acid-binding Zn-ribbon protein